MTKGSERRSNSKKDYNSIVNISERSKMVPQRTIQPDKMPSKALKGMPQRSFALNNRASKNLKFVVSKQPDWLSDSCAWSVF